MLMSDSQELEAPAPKIEPHPIAGIVAPVAAIMGTMVVRKIVSSAYEKATGRQAPEARNPATSWPRALVWTVIIAASAGAAEVIIYRLVNQIGDAQAPRD